MQIIDISFYRYKLLSRRLMNMAELEFPLQAKWSGTGKEGEKARQLFHW